MTRIMRGAAAALVLVPLIVAAGCGGSKTSLTSGARSAAKEGIALPDAARYAPQDTEGFEAVDLSESGGDAVAKLAALVTKQPVARTGGWGAIPFHGSVSGGIDGGAIAALGTSWFRSPQTHWETLVPSLDAKKEYVFWTTASVASIFEMTDSVGVKSWLARVGGVEKAKTGGFIIYETRDKLGMAISGHTFIAAIDNQDPVAYLRTLIQTHAGSAPSLAADTAFVQALSLVQPNTPIWQWFRGGTVSHDAGMASYDNKSPLPEAVARALFGDGDVVSTTAWVKGFLKIRFTGTKVGVYDRYGKPSSFAVFDDGARSSWLAVKVGGLAGALPDLLTAITGEYPNLSRYAPEITNAVRGGFAGILAGPGLRITLLPHELVQASAFFNRLNESSATQRILGEGGSLSVNIRDGTLEVGHGTSHRTFGGGLSQAVVGALHPPADVHAVAFVDLGAFSRTRRARMIGTYQRSWADRLGQILAVAYRRADKRPQVELVAQIRGA